MILLEFLNSEFWADIRIRVLATFGFAGIGTATNALPILTEAQSQSFIELEYSIRILTLFSYAMSLLVGITVLWRFVIWLKDRKNNNIKNNNDDQKS